MVENEKAAPDEAGRIANEMMALPMERPCPPNHVPRTLNFRDRNNIYGISIRHLAKNPSPKEQKKYHLLSTVLRFEETKVFFAVTEDDLADRIDDWNRARLEYRLWRAVHSGTKTLKKALEELPTFKYDPSDPPSRPPSMKPDYDPDEKTGPTSTFFVPKRIDDWLVSILQKDDLDGVGISDNINEGLVELFDKYGIVQEEDL